MIYLIAGGLCTFYGMSSGLGALTLLRPLLDAISPLSSASIAMLCTMAALAASLVGAFFALNQPLSLSQDDLLLIAVGSALGGILGDLAAYRFLSMLSENAASFLQNALLLTLIALPMLYFSRLSGTIRPLSLGRTMLFPASMVLGLVASFLSFGAEPLSLMLLFLLFDATDKEATLAALEVTLFAMAGKLIIMLIRSRFILPDAGVLLWLLPGVLAGALVSMVPRIARIPQRAGEVLMRLSMFTTLMNIAASSLV